MSLSKIVVHTETLRNFSVPYKLSLYNNKSRQSGTYVMRASSIASKNRV